MPLPLRRLMSVSALLLGARILAKLSTIVVVVVVARLLGVVDFGVYSFFAAYALFPGMLADFGLTLPLIRAVSRQEEESAPILDGMIHARLFWGGIALCVSAVAGLALNLAMPLVLLFTAGAILEAYATGLIRAFEGKQEMGTVTRFIIFERFVFLILIVGSCFLFRSVLSVAIAYVASNAIVCGVVLSAFRRRFDGARAPFRLASVWEYSKIGAPFVITALVSTVYYKADTLLLKAYRSDAEVGIYNAALRVFDAQMFIPMSIMASLFPMLSRLYRTDVAEFGRVFRQSLLLFVALGCAVGGVLLVFSSAIVGILFAEQYQASASILGILSIMIAAYFVNFLLSQTLVAMHRERWFANVMVATALASVAGNALLIPSYGAAGAAWLRTGLEISAMLAFLALVFRELRQKQNDEEMTAPRADGGAGLAEP